jgi:hypothetical protein
VLFAAETSIYPRFFSSAATIMIHDPKWYARPFTVKVTHLLQPDTDILEYIRIENEQDRRRMGLK